MPPDSLGLAGAACSPTEDWQPFREGFPIPHAGGRVSPAQEFLGSAVVPGPAGPGAVAGGPADPAAPPAWIRTQPRPEEPLGLLGLAHLEVRLPHRPAPGIRHPLLFA